MNFSRRRKFDPLRELVRQMRVAACQIDTPPARRIAAREAERIPLTMIEKAHGKRGQMAELGRSIMRALPDAAPERFADLASVLRGCADAIDSRFEVTSETELGKKPKGQAA